MTAFPPSDQRGWQLRRFLADLSSCERAAQIWAQGRGLSVQFICPLIGWGGRGTLKHFSRKPGLAAPTPRPRPVSCQVRLVSVLLSDSRNSHAWKIITVIWIKRREDETSSSFLFSNKLELYSSKWFPIRFGCPSGWSWQRSCVGTAARRQPGPRQGWGHVSANAVIHKEALLSGS